MADHAFRENAVILTGASSGIGRALALEPPASGRGWCWRRATRRSWKRWRLSAGSAAPRRLVVPTDVTDEAACRALVERAVAAHGGIDVLVLNAGVSMWARFDEIRTLAPSSA